MPIPNIPPGFTVSDIKTELGSGNNSLLALGQSAGFQAPFLMSDFAGYVAYTNAKYYTNDGVNDYAQITGGNSARAIGDGTFSISFWVRNNASSHQNHQIINIAPGFSASDRLMIDYNTTNNQLRFNHRQGGSNNIAGFYLNSNSSVTGVSTSWTAGDRGNTNADGWIMLTYIYEGRGGIEGGLTVYWNDSPIDSNAISTAGSRSPLTMTNMRVGENIHTTGSAGCATMDFDEIKIYNTGLSQTDITNLWNNGAIADSAETGVTSGLISEITFDGGTMVDTAGHFSNSGTLNNGGTTANH